MGELSDKLELMKLARMLKSICEADDPKQQAKIEHEFVMEQLRVSGITDLKSVSLDADK